MAQFDQLAKRPFKPELKAVVGFDKEVEAYFYLLAHAHSPNLQHSLAVSNHSSLLPPGPSSLPHALLPPEPLLPIPSLLPCRALRFSPHSPPPRFTFTRGATHAIRSPCRPTRRRRLRVHTGDGGALRVLSEQAGPPRRLCPYRQPERPPPLIRIAAQLCTSFSDATRPCGRRQMQPPRLPLRALGML